MRASYGFLLFLISVIVGCSTTYGFNRRCKAVKMDLLLVLDSSGSITAPNFVKMKDFLKKIVDVTDVTGDRTRIGLIQFSDEPNIEFEFNSYKTESQVKAAIDKVQYMEGTTRLGAALKYANSLLSPQKGHRSDAQTVVVVLTDGESDDNPVCPAKRLQKHNATVFAIGVTKDIDEKQLMAITGDPNKVMTLKSFDQLDSRLRKQLAKQICTKDKVANYADCTCEYVDGFPGGCVIISPAPPGHKCRCTLQNNGRFYCQAKAVRCRTHEVCPGYCVSRDCCVGDCHGYDY